MNSRIQSNKRKTVNDTGLDLVRGKRLGKYRLERHLGTGGSCEVWKAKDCVEGMFVALKIPLMDVSGQRNNQALFREIRMVTKLRHRHIMPVKNADIIEDHVVLATELSFKTLDDCSRPMSVRRILSIIAQVLDGLAYAHRHRLIHCDVTPGNIFLFPNGRAALGDFGISQQWKGRMKTVDEFGTPGYVAPEQAYGRPTYRSDCFAVGLILYEYITGFLPRWPFRWPARGHKRLRERTNLALVKFVKQALLVDPARRFADAGQMLTALLQAMPKKLRYGFLLETHNKKQPDWRQVRREDFAGRYKKIFTAFYRCVECAEPVAESMLVCPWCGSSRNRFDTRSRFDYICPRCHRGVLPEWRFCPWCYGPGFESPASTRSIGVRYHGRCKYCKGKLLRFSRYCPWCRRKIRKAWQVRPFPEICSRCGWSVDTSFWNHCPWCKQILIV
ncbi:MAG TPA: serine/threonine-protein kinase [Sedimentisphaerales bacterium]|nr:serine/threonine-protein kinase [Sedimentisphaerales bacterium]